MLVDGFIFEPTGISGGGCKYRSFSSFFLP